MANLLMWQVQVMSYCVNRLLLAVCLSHPGQNGIKSGLSDCVKKKAHQHREDVISLSYSQYICYLYTPMASLFM